MQEVPGSDRMTTSEESTKVGAPRLLDRLRNEIGPELTKEFGYSSVMEIPRLEKIVINIGLGEALQNNKAIESATSDLTQITGQKPITKGLSNNREPFVIGQRLFCLLDLAVSCGLPFVLGRRVLGVSQPW